MSLVLWGFTSGLLPFPDGSELFRVKISLKYTNYRLWSPHKARAPSRGAVLVPWALLSWFAGQ